MTPQGECLAHVDRGQLPAALAALGRSSPLDARGVVIDGALLQHVLEFLGRDADGVRRIRRPARFDQAIFEGDANFEAVEFGRDVWFDGAQFKGRASFSEARVVGHVRFAQAVFEDQAVFNRSTFGGQSWFSGAHFRNDASFSGATFEGPVWFAHVTFHASARFDHVAFNGDLQFDQAAFLGQAMFDEAVFEREARFIDTKFARPGQFQGAMFRGKGGIPDGVAPSASRSPAEGLAPWSARAGAALLDSAIPLAFIASAAGLSVAAEALQYYGALPVYLVIGTVAALVFTVRNLWIQGNTGQTLGKRRTGIWLVREKDARPVGPVISLARAALHLLDTLPAMLGWVWALWDPKVQTFADKVVSTIVIRSERSQTVWSRPPVVK